MAEPASKVPVNTEERPTERSTALQGWRPLDSLRREIDHLYEDFDRDFWRHPFRRSIFDVEPFWRRELTWGAVPTVDIVETNNAYEVMAELPGMDGKNVEVKVANGVLTIRGQKQEEKEEKTENYHLHERRFGSFRRSFAVPEGVDTDKIEASFKNGILTVRLPKKPEAMKAEKKIEVKAAV
jgi:HSP20 family protein